MRALQRTAQLTRRRFLETGARGAGLLGLGSAALVGSGRLARGASHAEASALTYNVEPLKRVDPKLIQYAEVGRLPSPRGEPQRVMAGPDGGVSVAAGNYVTVLDARGGTRQEIALDGPARCLALSTDGALYVGLRERIEVYDAAGQRRASWAAPAPRTWFVSLAVGANEVFASDAGNRTVVRYDRSGKLLGRIGGKDKDASHPGFIVPSPYFDLSLGADGLLWVANPGRHRLEAYSLEGALRSSWGEASFDIKGFCGCCNPAHFTRLPDGRFVTSEKGLPRVKVYSATGQFECVVAAPALFPKYFEHLNATPPALDVAADAAGRILVADPLGGAVRVFEHKPG